MTNWVSNRFSSIGGVQIHYRRGGLADARPAILSHGITDSSECWPAIDERLAEHFDVIKVDARGHGLSDQPDGGYSYTKLVNDLLELIRQLDLHEPLLIGHSMGAQASAMLAGVAPEIPWRVVLEDPPWRHPDPDGPPGGGYGEIIRYFADLPLSDIAESGRLLHANWEEDELDPWVRSKHQVIEATAETLRFVDWQKTVDALVCQALLLTGDQSSGAIVPASIARDAAARNPLLRHTHLAGAGHSIRRDQRASFVEAVMAFVRE